MPDMSAPLMLGADIWNQYVEWPTFRAAHQTAEELGYDSLWTMDHVYPPERPDDGAIFEAFTAMSAIAEVTTRPTISVMVASNTYRNHDFDTMKRLAHEVRPRLAALIDT